MSIHQDQTWDELGTKITDKDFKACLTPILKDSKEDMLFVRKKDRKYQQQNKNFLKEPSRNSRTEKYRI